MDEYLRQIPRLAYIQQRPSKPYSGIICKIRLSDHRKSQQ
jgi:hypothetical protein